MTTWNRIQRPSTASPTNVIRAVEQRRKDLQRAQDTAVSITRVSGFVTVQNAGEATLDVRFPVWFVERPSISFGGEMADGHSPEVGNFPTVSVVVLRWIQQTRGTATWWVGANLAIVTAGREDHKIIVHWQAEGKAMVNPISSSHDTDGVL